MRCLCAIAAGVTFALVSGCGGGGREFEPPLYEVTDLGTLGGSGSYGRALNDAGQVVGESFTSGDAVLHGFVHDGGSMHDVPPLGGQSSFLRDINDAGQAVGLAQEAHGYGRAILYDVGAQTTTDLGDLGGVNAGAHAVNDRGDVVGYSLTTFQEYHAFLLPAGGTMSDLGTLGGSWSEASGINECGQVVGRSRTTVGSYTEHAFLWKGGQMTDLGTLGGRNSIAHDINNLGQVVGRSSTGHGSSEAFVWSECRGMVCLGTLGGTGSEAFGIDDCRHIVGFAQIADGSQHAFLYDLRTETMHDLNEFLSPNSSDWTLNEAHGINRRGQIAGWGNKLYTGLRAFLATPVQQRTAAPAAEARLPDFLYAAGPFPRPPTPRRPC